MIKILIDNGQGPVDYTRYLFSGSLKVEDSINQPTLTTFLLSNNDNGFVVPVRNAFVQIFSSRYNKYVATGVITNEPIRKFIGLNPKASSFNFQAFEFQINVTSEEYLLNMKQIPYVPAFTNRGSGQILADWANQLMPGFFDVTSFVASGDLIPKFDYDPTKTWSDYAKTFADQSRFRYKVINRTIIFQPYGDADLGVTYDERNKQGTFDPYKLDTQVLTVPVVNDVIVVGDVEAATLHDDYFIGDGFSSSFALRHKVFRGQTASLLQDDWTEQKFSTTDWTVEDPTLTFTLAGALNAIGGAGLGTSYILANNGFEMAGKLNFQHGEFYFTDTNTGLLGGIYNSLTLQTAVCEAGWDVRPSLGGIVLGASGAAGISIQPTRFGVLQGTPVITKANHHYFLSTIMHSRCYSRYNRIFRTKKGQQYGGDNVNSLVDIVWVLQDIDLANPNNPVETRFTLLGATVAPFCWYAPLNAVNLNLALNFTQVSLPPQGTLTVQSLSAITGAQLPVLPGSLGVEHGYLLGFGFQGQTATLLDGQENSSLEFYANTIPGVGARIRLQTWEAKAAIARVQDPAAIALEALFAGDDGTRTAVMFDLKPIPRTSAECELAGKAAIVDRELTQYQGTYTFSSFFLLDPTSPDYPVPGRFFSVNAPIRNINKLQFFVQKVTTTVLDLFSEVLAFQIQFGQDTYLDKTLNKFVDVKTAILKPQDLAVKPTPLQLSQVGVFYAPDLVDAKITNITASTITLDFGVVPVTGAEVRRTDTGWGSNDLNLIGRFTTQVVTLPRTQFEQAWYIRQVNGASTSRYTKMLRTQIPTAPLAPVLVTANSQVIQLGLTGDIRNICGIEVRAADDTTVLLQRRFGAPQDLFIDLTKIAAASGNRTFKCYFFNLRWDYSPVLSVNIPAPIAPVLSLGNKFGFDIEVRPDFSQQSDILRTTVVFATDAGFTVNVVSVTGNGQPPSVHLSATAALAYFVKAYRSDYLGDGAVSTTLNVPAGTLIASGYGSAQGSIPPVITQIIGSLFTFSNPVPGSTTTGIINVSWPSFTVAYPNGTTQLIPSGSAQFTGLAANAGTLNTQYYFYFYLQDPTLSTVALGILGPFSGAIDPTNSVGMVLDGRAPLNGTAVTTNVPGVGAGAPAGGGGGGSDSTGCIIDGTLITLEDGRELPIEVVKKLLPVALKTPTGRKGILVGVDELPNQKLYKLKLKSGKEKIGSKSDSVFANDFWQKLVDLANTMPQSVWTEDGFEDEESVTEAGYGKVNRLHMLDNGARVYSANGIWTHNVINKA